jgi:hypothetical protein
MVVNSCKIPLNLTEVIAAPGRDESRTLRRELPKVTPNPRSSGWRVNFPKVFE